MLWVIFTAVAAFTAWAVWANRRWLRAALALAEERGWSFTKGNLPGHTAPFEGRYALFGRGYGRVARDLFRGSAGGRALEVFQYQYTLGHGKKRVFASQAVVHLEDPALALPAFALRPSGWTPGASAYGRQPADGVGAALGVPEAGNVPLPGALAATHLGFAADPAATADRLTPAVAGAVAGLPGASVDAGGAHLFVFRDYRAAKPAELPALVEHAHAVAEALAASAGGRGGPPAFP